MVQGKYEFFDKVDKSVSLQIYDPNGKLFQTIKIEKEGKFSFISEQCMIFLFVIFY